MNNLYDIVFSMTEELVPLRLHAERFQHVSVKKKEFIDLVYIGERGKNVYTSPSLWDVTYSANGKEKIFSVVTPPVKHVVWKDADWIAFLLFRSYCTYQEYSMYFLITNVYYNQRNEKAKQTIINMQNRSKQEILSFLTLDK